MIDLHCHILPEVDDGARTQEEAFKMAEQAVSEGITHILCTPHHNNGVFLNPKNKVISKVAALQSELDRCQLPLTLFEGQEVRLSGDLMHRIQRDEILFADLEDIYILIEFPSSNIPVFAEQVLFELRSNKITPVIVHPERNRQLIRRPNDFLPFLEMGCIGQVTCGSYLGNFGKEIARTAKLMIEHHMVHVLASDAHNITGRGFFMKAAYELLEKEFGSSKRLLFEQTAKDIVNGDVFSKKQAVPVNPYKFGLFR